MKSFKNLFIKDEDEQEKRPVEKPGFPVSEPPTQVRPSNPTSNPYADEIMEVYEKGLESINMPGYDFFDFFNAIKAAGSQTEAVYKMAFQMGKAMDSSITPQKLVSDADYYISKINEVNQTYSNQGRLKLDSLEAQLRTDRDKLSSEVARIEADITKMKQQIIALEKTLAETRGNLNKVDNVYKPQQETIQQKLIANDQAMQLCVQQLNSIKESILTYLK